MEYRFKIFIKKHNQSGTYSIELLSNLRLTRPARNSMNLECSSHDSNLKYVFAAAILCVCVCVCHGSAVRVIDI